MTPLRLALAPVRELVYWACAAILGHCPLLTRYVACVHVSPLRRVGALPVSDRLAPLTVAENCRLVKARSSKFHSVKRTVPPLQLVPRYPSARLEGFETGLLLLLAGITPARYAAR